MTPIQRYQEDIAQGLLLPDEAQARAIVHVQRVYDDVMAAERRGSRDSWWGRLAGALAGKPAGPVKGLYFHGGVGRGKTYIMDTFYECLPLASKQRTHFHRFMQMVHGRLTALKGQKNPLEQVAADIAENAQVLCFDEFFVSDIGDAMILGRLLEHLLEAGVVLIATSNIHPDGLYANGLQRERFLPAIALLHKHTDIIELDGGVDYRLRALKQASLYFSPLGDDAEQALKEAFARLAPEHADSQLGGEIGILGRSLPVRRVADDVVWFDFDDLCDGARSAYDYIELAKVYHAVVLGGVPQMGPAQDDVARRFVSLVDELYDRHVKLILSAAVPLSDLYIGQGLAFVFERTRSRLLEMQSEEYLAREHRP
ncbi:cell division protein ZapE [Pseudohongiella sp.]|uniref:AAA+ ATPase domain-containing protein n=1 Tax=marine sediment metagenome TaxID=412755 RepID=A0A0F9VJV2_9ZZZZ|nr:cell division protein ZapE [Pseudohongiella sp.]HDZ10439.1 cell division protein ZapE [Pseudohongiella sp.]HEA62224.1 cell division protein ZapE [Pseudohongiella sp.]